jgi:hypothetical protein
MTGARGLDQARNAAEPRPQKTRRDRFPERLVGVDDVDLGAKPPESPNHPGHKADAEERPAGCGLNPAVYEDTIVFFIINGIARHGPGDHMNDVSAAGQLAPLCQGLSLGAACEGIKEADDEADS